MWPDTTDCEVILRNALKKKWDPGLIKLMTADNRFRTGNLAMELLGAGGLGGDSAPTHWAQTELMGRFSVSIGGGTNEVLRNNLGERALGLPREPNLK